VVAKVEEERDHVPMVIYNILFLILDHITHHIYCARLGLTLRLARNCGLIRTICRRSIMIVIG